MTGTVPPEQVLAALKNDARPQKCRALDVVNAICAELHKVGGRDFSVATIGRLSEQRGGPSMRTLYNAQSEHYRILIKAWAECARAAEGTSAGAAAKPLAEDDLLRRIPDPALRALFGTIVAERNRLRSEINVLRSHTNIVVDRRVLPGNIAVADGQITQVLTPGDRLLPMEREALARAISFKFLEQEGWREGPNGEILNAKGRKLFELGYGTAIRKTLGGQQD